jgi:hypothetical protein
VVTGKKRSFANFRAKMAACSIVAEDGKRLFTFEEARQLGSKSAIALDRVFDVARRLSGFSDKDVEDLSGN